MERTLEVDLTILGLLAACGPCDLRECFREVRTQAPSASYMAASEAGTKGVFALASTALALETGNRLAVMAANGLVQEYENMAAFEPTDAGLRLLAKHDRTNTNALRSFRQRLEWLWQDEAEAKAASLPDDPEPSPEELARRMALVDTATSQLASTPAPKGWDRVDTGHEDEPV